MQRSAPKKLKGLAFASKCMGKPLATVHRIVQYDFDLLNACFVSLTEVCEGGLESNVKLPNKGTSSSSSGSSNSPS